LADLGSREFCSDNYSIDPVSFSSLESTYGKFTVDAMVTSANTVCSKFYSRYSSPGSSGVKFFAQTLSQKEYFYVFPPLKRAVEVIQHLTRFRCSVVLVIPVWPRSWIFSHFFPDRNHCAEWVKSLELICPVFSSGPSVGQVFKGRRDFKTAIFQFDFKNQYLSLSTVKSPQFCLQGGCASCC
jgi:hypothetical protein